MFKNLLLLLLSAFLLFACSKKNEVNVISEITDEEKAKSIYIEAVEALKKGDSFYSAKKFREVESLVPLGEWAAKASLMASYSDYNRSSYSAAIFSLERLINYYPADKNIS